MAKPVASGAQLSKDEIKFLEGTLAALPTQKTTSVDGDADGLLKFGYHQNPYVRTYCKVLWSGYALARGQLGDGSQRFSQARRDATVSAVDQGTIKALDDAAAALEHAMAPNGSIGTFLAELRDKTMQRCWSRVCETCGLPPPRFHVLYGNKPLVNPDELDAEEEAEMAALRKAPPLASADEVAAPDGVDPEDNDFADDFEDADEADEALAHEERRELPSPGDAPGAPTAGGAIQVQRHGQAELAGELLLSAASEVLRHLRTRKPGGALQFTITVESQRGEGKPAEGKGEVGDHRRRRRRRR